MLNLFKLFIYCNYYFFTKYYVILRNVSLSYAFIITLFVISFF